MKKLSLVITLLLVLAFGFFFFAPAALLDTWFLHKNNSVLRLSNTEGSLWSGEGQIIVHLPGAEGLKLPKAHWRVSPIAALTGRISGRLSAADGSLSADFDAVQGGQHLREVKLKMPMTSLAMALMLSALSPEGETTLAFPQLSIQNGVPAGEGDLLWQNASLFLPNTSKRLNLGDVRAHLSLSANGMSFVISNQGGQARLSGMGSISGARATQLDLAIVPTEDLGADIQVALAQLGRSEAGGGFKISKP
ncbi:MAG: hypothetical protein RLZZ502_1808 [Pseudomonadota bacterium]|jgi:hypothetical protein